MSSPLNDAAANALRIAGEVVCDDHEQLLLHPEAARFAQITQAAAVLAHIEQQPGFAWHENGRTDWETCCARIARRIESGKPLNRAGILKATRAR
jgi:hypothetical protein